MIPAMAMIGTACCGPNTSTIAGINITEVPKPTMPPSVPAARPSVRTST